MIDFISKLFGLKNPKSVYYKKKLSKFHSLTNYFIYLRDLSNTKKKYTTTLDIRLKGSSDFFIINEKEVIKSFGKPDFRMNLYDNKSLQAFLYKTYMGKHRATFELHFFEGELYFYSYSFSMLTGPEKETIANVVKEKYIEKADVKCNNIYIEDHKGAQIFINDGVNFSIDYLLMSAEALKDKMKIAMIGEKDNKAVDELFLSDDFYDRI